MSKKTPATFQSLNPGTIFWLEVRSNPRKYYQKVSEAWARQVLYTDREGTASLGDFAPFLSEEEIHGVRTASSQTRRR